MGNNKIWCEICKDQFLDAFTLFHKLYEENFKNIEHMGNSFEMQVSFLKKWIKGLTEQNTLLAHTVLDLEREVIKRTHIIEGRNVESQNKCVQVDVMEACTDDRAAFESAREQLSATVQIIRNKDEMLNIQAQSLRLYESRFSELSERAKSLQSELAARENEIYELRYKGPPIYSDGFDTIEQLKIDLSVAESKYRDCYDQNVHQEQTINLLRQAYLDFRIREFEYISEIESLQSSLKRSYEQIDQCHAALGEVEKLKEEIRRCMQKCDLQRSKSIHLDRAMDDLTDMKFKLNNLKDLIEERGSESEIPLKKVAEMNIKISELEIENRSLLNRMDMSMTAFEEKEIEVKALRNLLEINSSELDVLRLEKKVAEGALHEMQKYSRDLKSDMTASQEKLRESRQQIRRSKKIFSIIIKKKLKLAKTQRRLTVSLKSRCKIIHMKLKNMGGDYNQALRCIHGLQVETMNLTNQMYHWQSVASESEERINNLKNENDTLRLTIVELKIGEKDDAVPWINMDYNDTIENGTKICNESKKLTSGVRDWLERSKSERDLLSSTIRTLKRKNRQLKSRLRDPDLSSSSSLEASDSPPLGSASRLRQTSSISLPAPISHMPLYAGFYQLMGPVTHPQNYWESPYIPTTATPQYPPRLPQRSFGWEQRFPDP